MDTIIERCARQIRGVVRCFDRVVLQASLPGVGFPAGMQMFLNRKGIKIFDFAEFAKPLTDLIHNTACDVAEDHGIVFAHANSRSFDKEKLADAFDVRRLHAALDYYARLFCPVGATFNCSYRWGLMQIEYATDIVFKERQALQDLYQPLVRIAVQAVKAEDVMLFFGRKLTAAFQGALDTSLRTRELGTRLKHRLGPSSIKVYDKFGIVLRIETTTNDVASFKQHRAVRQRDGQVRFKKASVPTSIYSLTPDMSRLLGAANERYLAFLSTLHTPTEGIKALRAISEPVRHNQRPYKGFNLFSGPDQLLFEILAQGEFTISGVRNRDLRARLPGTSTGQISRQLKRLRLHGLIKQVAGSFKYYPTSLGRRAIVAALAVKHFTVIPALTPVQVAN